MDTPVMSISICQQGDRLRHHRPNGKRDSFTPSKFSLILINTDTNEIIGTSKDNSETFLHSMLVQRPLIEKGKYVLVSDVIWNECVS